MGINFGINASVSAGVNVGVNAGINVGVNAGISAGINIGARAGIGNRSDPYAAFRFRVEIMGLSAGGFTEVSGIQSETEVEEYREGGVNDYVHKFPKVTKYPNLVLKRGVADIDLLWAWYKAVVEGFIQPLSVTVYLMDREGEDKRQWSFNEAYPVKWSGPELKADSSTVAVETIELVHKGMSWV